MKHLTRFVLASASLVSLSLAVPALAHAADGYVTGNVNLRAGPDSSYPLIDLIPAGTEVDVQGCTDGWEWCDVIVYGNRGWVAGNYIEYEYQDQPVLLPRYGAQIGIPIISFTIGSYWDNYYRSRPFYRDRDHWYHRRIERRPAPPPLRHPYRGPMNRNAASAHPPHPGPLHPRRVDQGHHQSPQQQHPAPRPPQHAAPSRPSRAAPTSPPDIRRQARPAAPAHHAAPVQQVRPIHDNRSQGSGHPPPAQHDANGKKRPAATDKKDRHDHNDGH